MRNKINRQQEKERKRERERKSESAIGGMVAAEEPMLRDPREP